MFGFVSWVIFHFVDHFKYIRIMERMVEFIISQSCVYNILFLSLIHPRKVCFCVFAWEGEEVNSQICKYKIICFCRICPLRLPFVYHMNLKPLHRFSSSDFQVERCLDCLYDHVNFFTRPQILQRLLAIFVMVLSCLWI